MNGVNNMTKCNTKKAIFILSGIAAIVLIVMFGRSYNSNKSVEPAANSSTESYTGTAKAGERFGDWSVACEKEQGQDGAADKNVCFLSQVLTSQPAADTSSDKKDKKEKVSVQKVAEFRIGYFGGSKELKMIQILPFGINLQAGTSIIITKDKLVSPGKFTTCQPFGCLAVADLTDTIDSIASATESAFVGVMTIDGKQMNIPLSIKGLKDGVAALK
jgi:invasion protein IalB